MLALGELVTNRRDADLLTIDFDARILDVGQDIGLTEGESLEGDVEGLLLPEADLDLPFDRLVSGALDPQGMPAGPDHVPVGCGTDGAHVGIVEVYASAWRIRHHLQERRGLAHLDMKNVVAARRDLNRRSRRTILGVLEAQRISPGIRGVLQGGLTTGHLPVVLVHENDRRVRGLGLDENNRLHPRVSPSPGRLGIELDRDSRRRLGITVLVVGLALLGAVFPFAGRRRDVGRSLRSPFE